MRTLQRIIFAGLIGIALLFAIHLSLSWLAYQVAMREPKIDFTEKVERVFLPATPSALNGLKLAGNHADINSISLFDTMVQPLKHNGDHSNVASIKDAFRELVELGTGSDSGLDEISPTPVNRVLGSYLYVVYVKHWSCSSKVSGYAERWWHGGTMLGVPAGYVSVDEGEWSRSYGVPTIDKVAFEGDFRNWFAQDLEWIAKRGWITYLSVALLVVGGSFRGVLRRAVEMSKRGLIAGKTLLDRFDKVVEKMNG